MQQQQQQQHHRLGPQDWDAIAGDPEFRALLARKRRFIIPTTIFFFAYYLALPILVGFVPQFMSRPVLGPLTIAFVFALSQFVVAWLLMIIYLRRSKSFDDAEGRIAARIHGEFTK